MAYIQKNNPIPRTGCGRRRLSRMKNPFKMDLNTLGQPKGTAERVKNTKFITRSNKEMGLNKYGAKELRSPALEYVSGGAAKALAGAAKSLYKGYKSYKKGKTARSAMKKISGPCKAAAKRKFKVWPSAYASGWGVRCTRNPRKYLKRK